MTEPQQPNGRLAGWLNAIKGLTLTNVLVTALLVPVLGMAYLIYKALNDEAILDKLLSAYEEKPDQSGCLLRHVRARGGPDQYSISSGFAVMGIDRWYVTVLIPHPPTDEEAVSYCQSLKLLADQLMGRSDRDGPPDR